MININTKLLISVSLIFILKIAVAQENFSGNFLSGYRYVDISGVEHKYLQHFNLERGPRLFELNFYFEPTGKLATLSDQMDLSLHNFGGDPFETLSFRTAKFGSYSFKYQRRKAAYYYHDTILPSGLAEGGLAAAGDFRTFNFDRVIDNADLELWLNSDVRLNLGFERFVKEGESTLPQDIARDEFELDQPVSERNNTYRIALQYAFDNTTIVLEENIKDYENDTHRFLPGFSGGEDSDDFTQLSNYVLNNPYEFDSYSTTVRMVSRPVEKLTLRAAANYNILDMQFDYSESASGINYDSTALGTNISGDGNANRDIQMYDLDASYVLTERLTLTGAFRYRRFDQEGESFVADMHEMTEWDYSNTGFDGGIRYHFPADLTVSAGAQYETRQVTNSHKSEEESASEELPETNRIGLFGHARWKPLNALSIDVDYKFGTFDNPFTLTSPSDFTRLRSSVRYRVNDPFYLTALYMLNRIENTESGWTSDQNRYALRLNYQQERLQGYVGYNLQDIRQEIDQNVVTVGFGGGDEFLFPIRFEGVTHLFDGQLKLRLNRRLKVGSHVLYHDNQETWPLSRVQLQLFSEIRLPENYLVRINYRYIDYEENRNHFNDYSANIAEASIGYRW